MIIFYGKWFLWIKVWEERAWRFKSFGTFDRMIKEEDTSIAMTKIVVAIVLHDLAYSLLMYFYFARFKPTSVQMTPATVLIPLLDFFVQVLPLVIQLLQRITEKIHEISDVKQLFSNKNSVTSQAVSSDSGE